MYIAVEVRRNTRWHSQAKPNNNTVIIVVHILNRTLEYSRCYISKQVKQTRKDRKERKRNGERESEGEEEEGKGKRIRRALKGCFAMRIMPSLCTNKFHSDALADFVPFRLTFLLRTLKMSSLTGLYVSVQAVAARRCEYLTITG